MCYEKQSLSARLQGPCFYYLGVTQYGAEGNVSTGNEGKQNKAGRGIPEERPAYNE